MHILPTTSHELLLLAMLGKAGQMIRLAYDHTVGSSGSIMSIRPCKLQEQSLMQIEFSSFTEVHLMSHVLEAGIVNLGIGVPSMASSGKSIEGTPN